jgi:hypothetical protein
MTHFVRGKLARGGKTAPQRKSQTGWVCLPCLTFTKEG